MPTHILIGASLSSVAVFAAVFLAARLWGPYWDTLSERQMGRLNEQFERLALDRSKYHVFLRVWGVALVLVGVVFGVLLNMVPVAVMLLFLTYVAPRHILEYLIRRRTKLLRDQLVAATVGVGNAVKAGLSLPQGIEAICNETPQPLAGELNRIVFDFNRGRPLKAALEKVRHRLDLESFTLFALALEAAIDRGGRLDEALDRISHSLQENQRLERKLETETASGKQTVLILGSFPAIFLISFYLLDPHSTSLLFTMFSGQVVLAVVIALTYAGSRWASSMMRIEL